MNECTYSNQRSITKISIYFSIRGYQTLAYYVAFFTGVNNVSKANCIATMWKRSHSQVNTVWIIAEFRAHHEHIGPPATLQTNFNVRGTQGAHTSVLKMNV